ncbi:hypothetical protein NECAME_12327 [Necator americanus]|uniref:Uncharacterized protein n=1 Tax=Necator americanus TaxID=51031 RepID=W2T0S5_NECAM|nr:hypothetical protein NECAME_12327 [Necator americanus]ETN75498.1 hypothetical protein NECAME_12327 [Necator americanus]
MSANLTTAVKLSIIGKEVICSKWGYFAKNLAPHEVFMNLPPVFENEEFLSLSQSASPELVICYLSSSIDALPLPNRQRAYLLCCSLRNLLDFTSHRGESLTAGRVTTQPCIIYVREQARAWNTVVYTVK